MQRLRTVTSPTFLTELCPFENFKMENLSVYPLRYFLEIWYKYKASLAAVQRTRTVTPLTFLTELCPFENLGREAVSTYISETH